MSSADSSRMGALLARFGLDGDTLRGRVLLAFGGMLLLSMAATCLTLYLALIAEIDWVDDQILTKRLETVRGLVGTEADRDYWLNHEVSEDMSGPRRIYIRVARPTGETIVETPGMLQIAPFRLFPMPPASAQGRVSRTIAGLSDDRFRATAAYENWADDANGDVPVIIQIAADTSLDGRALGTYRLALVVLAVFITTLACWLGARWLSRLVAPVARISAEVGATNLETLGNPISAHGLTAELRDLTDQFNAMSSRLAEASAGLRHYADNAAHELRTPINRMMLNLDIALSRPRDIEEYKEVISQAASDSRDIARLIDRLLFLARASNQQASFVPHDVDLSAELEGIAEYFAASAAEAEIALELDRPEGLHISADRVLLQRALNNIVGNALAYTEAGGSISISACREGDAAVVEVADTGIGMTADDVAHAFERFYRADAARDGRSGHVGLGLAITKSIVELHGGRIALKSAPGAGTTVIMRWPAKSLPLAIAAE